jgi:hypothetical protein
MIEKIWSWIKALVKLPTLFRRRQAQEETEPAAGQLSELDKKLGREIQKREASEGKSVRTSTGSPNMPKYYFCKCDRRCKRVRKTVGGAYYKCRIHGEFFVRAPMV